MESIGISQAEAWYATPEAETWICRLCAVLLATNYVPMHHCRLLMPTPGKRWYARNLLNRAENVLALWRTYYPSKPLTQAQELAYELCRAVDMRAELDWTHARYVGHHIARADAPMLRVLLDELRLTGQLLLPLAWMAQDEYSVERPAVLQALATANFLTSPTSYPDPLP